MAVVAGSVPLGLVKANDALYTYLPEQINGMTILFQGDSITDGKRGRNNDPNHIMGHGYAFSIASRWGADFPSNDLVFYNRGISGNTIIQLQSRCQTDCLDLHPDLLSILIGINDAAKFVETPVRSFELDVTQMLYTEIVTYFSLIDAQLRIKRLVNPLIF
ncbi:GDSL-type esterase/lipase family protein [Polluticaenibacter yanchengensis]|uniref:GDSL-type esterase/lipase family protein n=1 Tax=Polluticaenibacter yanchengensis TaxID=3014562 RepID=A0ABT4UFH9_9BACT|nr:GDSL-type esterase/lipase family protein [Chitinophagaceae bacterium LY-5]